MENLGNKKKDMSQDNETLAKVEKLILTIIVARKLITHTTRV